MHFINWYHLTYEKLFDSLRLVWDITIEWLSENASKNCVILRQWSVANYNYSLLHFFIMNWCFYILFPIVPWILWPLVGTSGNISRPESCPIYDALLCSFTTLMVSQYQLNCKVIFQYGNWAFHFCIKTCFPLFLWDKSMSNLDTS